MSVPVDLDRLREHVSERGGVAFLVTVGESGAPHVVSTGVTWDDGVLLVAPGSTSRANVLSGRPATLLWPGPDGSEYGLLVDTATAWALDDGPIRLDPAKAVLHRLASAEGQGPSCINLRLEEPC